MNINFLPDKIKKVLEDKFAGKIPVSIVRSSGAMDGQPGEGYVVSFKDKALVFSRKLGEESFSITGGGFGDDIKSLSMKKDNYNTFLEMNVKGQPFAIKVSGLDSKEVQAMCDQFKIIANSDGIEIKKAEKGGASPSISTLDPEPAPKERLSYLSSRTQAASPSPTPQELNKISPQIILATAMMYVASVDKNITTEENTYLVTIFRSNPGILNKALAVHKRTSYEDFLKIARKDLTTDQKTCIMANMVEIAMIDGTYSGEEQDIVEKFVSSMGISRMTYNSIMNALLVKNNISVLGE